MPEPPATIVLVHGAWHGSWCWQLLIPHLQAHGLAVQCVELPSVTSARPAGLPDDAQHLTAVLRGITGQVVLCGHSYGGAVVSAARLDGAQVRHLVFMCAYLPEAGQSVESSLRAAGQRRPGHWIRRGCGGRTQLDAERARATLYHDCPSATQDWALAQLRPQWALALSQTASDPAWSHHASTYLICSEDRALAPHLQRALYAARATQAITLASGHSPFLSQPLLLAQVLVARAR